MRVTYRNARLRVTFILSAFLVFGAGAATLTYAGVGALFPSAIHTVTAAPLTPTDSSYFTFESNTGTITDYDGVNGPTDIVIPETINGVAVTALGKDGMLNGLNGVFEGKGLTSVTVPNSVTYIGPAAFSNNPITSMTFGTPDYSGTAELILSGGSVFPSTISSLSIGNNVKAIESGAFSGTAITELFIPNSVERIDGGSLSRNLSLRSIIFGTEDYNGTPSVVLDSAFYKTSAVESIIINGVVKEISGSFFEVPQLTHLTIGDSVEIISSGSFVGNALTELFIPDSVKQIDLGAFSESYELKTLVFGTPNYTGTPTIETSSSFSTSPSKLETLIINGGVKSVGAGLSNTPLLKTLQINGNVERFENATLSNNQLTSISFPNSVTYVGAGAFASSSQLRSITFGDDTFSGEPNLVIGGGAFSSTDGIEEITFHSNVRRVSSGVFYNNKLTKLFLPASIEAIEPGAFWRNYITEITVAGSTPINLDAFVGNTQNTGEYIRLYTTDHSNPHNYQDFISEEFSYIVNPAAIRTYYSDTEGNTLAPTNFKTGDSLSDYTIAANPEADFSQYYRGGETKTVTATHIDGYEAPAPQSVTLKPRLNIASLVYSIPLEDGGAVSPGTGATPGVPNTGLPKAPASVNLLILAAALVAASSLVAYKSIRR